MTERSVLAAVSGIQADQTYLDSIGNNIANADTVGYKSSQVQFQDLLAEQLSGASGPTPTTAGINPVAVGSGVRVASNEVNLQEGSLEQTGNPTDVAIQGSGYLIVQSGGQQLFTRDGSLTTDANGDLTTQSGGLIQGWQANSSGTVNTSAPLTSIKIPQGETIGATATQNLTLGGNLPAGGTAPLTTTINAYDTLGNVVPVTVTFYPTTTANEWNITASVPGPTGSTGPSYIIGAAPTGTAPYAPGSDNVLFDPVTGQVKSVNGSTTSLQIAATALPNPPYSPATTPINLVFPATGSSNQVTQFNSASTVQVQSQDGYSSGTLQSFSIGQDGTITGAFSNGATLALGQIAIANFANATGLADQGGGLYATSPNSGQALIGTPGTGGRGALLGGELEQSNVDLGTELTNLITAQEAYTANTKTLTTSSNVIQALENVP